MSIRIGVVIPAHNEAGVIGDLLGRLTGAPESDALDIVVVANGCTDQTAAIARSAAGPVRVVEIDQASKVAALNAGDEHCAVFPRAYVDADVSIDAGTLLALVDVLADADLPLVASPTLTVDVSQSRWAVRQYYRMWALTDYRKRGHVGSGVYAVSAAGRARWGAFPDVIADDRFVQQRFQEHERRTLADHEFSVRAPDAMHAVIDRGVRIHAGNRTLPDHAGLARRATVVERAGALLGPVALKPWLWPALAVYIGARTVIGYLAGRLVRSERTITWNRDESSRSGGS